MQPAICGPRSMVSMASGSKYVVMFEYGQSLQQTWAIHFSGSCNFGTAPNGGTTGTDQAEDISTTVVIMPFGKEAKAFVANLESVVQSRGKVVVTT